MRRKKELRIKFGTLVDIHWTLENLRIFDLFSQ